MDAWKLWLARGLAYGVPSLMTLAGSLALVAWVRQQFRAVAGLGRIEDYLETNDSDGKLFRPIFTFEVAGQSYRVTDAISMGWKSFTVGTYVAIRFLPDAPESAWIVRRWIPLLHAVIVLSGIGFLLLAIQRGP